MRSLFPTGATATLAAALCAAVPAQASVIEDVQAGWFAPVHPGRPVTIDFLVKLTTSAPYTEVRLENNGAAVVSNGQTVFAPMTFVGAGDRTATYSFSASFTYPTAGEFGVYMEYFGDLILTYYELTDRTVLMPQWQIIYYDDVTREATPSECEQILEVDYWPCGDIYVLDPVYDWVDVEVPVYSSEPSYRVFELWYNELSFSMTVDRITGGGSGVGDGDGGVVVDVPEPASLALFGAGLLGLVSLRRRALAA